MLGGVGIAGAIAAGVFGLGWMLFHLLVIPLQAFIFMMLTIVYLSLSEDSHKASPLQSVSPLHPFHHP